MESSNFLPNSTAEQQKAKQTVMLCNHSDNTSKTSVEVNKTRFHSVQMVFSFTNPLGLVELYIHSGETVF